MVYEVVDGLVRHEQVEEGETVGEEEGDRQDGSEEAQFSQLFVLERQHLVQRQHLRLENHTYGKEEHTC